MARLLTSTVTGQDTFTRGREHELKQKGLGHVVAYTLPGSTVQR